MLERVLIAQTLAGASRCRISRTRQLPSRGPLQPPGRSGLRAFEPGDDPIRNRTELRGNRMVGAYCDQRTRVVAALAQFADQRKLTQKRHAEVVRQPRASAVGENLVPRAALAADVVAHVL